jgi:carboxymethylenebutenolidase
MICMDTVHERVEIEAMGAYVARPVEPGDHPGVIVGSEMFGVTGYIRRTTDRIAALGYTAIAPDFYHRTAPGFEGQATPEGRARGFELLQRLDREEVLADVRAAMAYLTDQAHTGGRMGMAGFSLGGHLAFFAATQLDLAAIAVVYPGWLVTEGTALGRTGPVLDLAAGIAKRGGRLLYLSGADDHVITRDETRLVAERLTSAGVSYEMVIYPGTPHGFLADERDTFRPAIAEDAWRRIAELFGTELRQA